MKLLSVNTARSIRLLETRYLNPRGKNIEYELIEWLKKTYQFQKFPDFPLKDVETQGLVFSGGRFPCGKDEDGKDKNIYVDLTIFNDGVVANTRSSTKDADEFLSEALILVAGEFHLAYSPEMVRKKLYLSEVEIKLDKALKFLNPKLEQFAIRISSLHESSPPIAYDFSSIGFWPDPAIQQMPPSPFRVERKLNTAWSENKYYSAAPLHTDHHLKLLEEFETILSA